MKVKGFFSFRKLYSSFSLAGACILCTSEVSKADSDTGKNRYGFIIKQMASGNYGGFFEYGVNEYIGLNVSAEYAYNFFSVAKNGVTISKENMLSDSLYGTLYYVEYLNFPLNVKFYPAGGDFAFNIGLAGGYPLIAKEQLLLGDLKKLTSDYKVNGKDLLNSFQFCVNAGFDYTASFGLITGLSYSRVISSFIHMEENYETVFDSQLQFKIGFDISKVVN